MTSQRSRNGHALLFRELGPSDEAPNRELRPVVDLHAFWGALVNDAYSRLVDSPHACWEGAFLLRVRKDYVAILGRVINLPAMRTRISGGNASAAFAPKPARTSRIVCVKSYDRRE